MRQQLSDIGESTSRSCTAFSAYTLNPAALVPSAFETKFYGLYDRSGNYLSSYAVSLFNSSPEVGADIHGRPFGDWFLYQVSILNGANVA